MPFKLRIRKTRHYNVLSRSVLVLSVELIDKTTLECTLSADSTGLECLHNVCQRLGLQQPEFFGLRYMSKRPYPKVRWVELDRPLKKQLDKYAQSPALSLAVQYYIHDVGLLQDDVTRSHYFLQVKQDVLEGKLRSNYEQAVLLASYSLQAEFGDHQPERHTPEYLKDFRLFPKQALSEGEMASLLEAVVWQYSSLTGLAQALAETYYILEAQRLPGYGQETFIARDEKGCEVYLGASLLGIIVQPASGEIQTFYRWNDITNLINHKRNFGIECSRSDETVQFTFEEPDAAKYVWKMCVKQHTFYKGNQDVLEGIGGVVETRSLAIPDLQSSVMASSAKNRQHPSAAGHDMVKLDGRIGDVTVREDLPNSRTLTASLPHLDLSFTPKSNDSTTNLASALENSTAVSSHESFGILSQSLYSLNNSRFSIKQPHHLHETHYGLPEQVEQSKHPDMKPQDALAVYSAGRSSSSARNSKRRPLLPHYRPTPDYETALIQKYGPNINTQVPTLLYSSQPEISHHVPDINLQDSRERDGGISTYNQYNAYLDFNTDRTSQQQRLEAIAQPGNLHNTYSSPELAQNSLEDDSEKRRVNEGHLDYHFIHGYKPPPPYPYSKSSSNSTPDLASTSKCEEKVTEPSWRKRSPLLTASLGCLGSPELSRTYENLTDLGDAVESLRQELTKSNKTSFLHSFTPNYSTDGLDVIYRLSNGHVAVGQNLNIKGSSTDQLASSHHVPATSDAEQEPIYQNVEILLSEMRDDARDRNASTSEVDRAPDTLQPSHQDHFNCVSLAGALNRTASNNTPSNLCWLPQTPLYVPEYQVPSDPLLGITTQHGNVVNQTAVSSRKNPHIVISKQESCTSKVSPQISIKISHDREVIPAMRSPTKSAIKETRKPDLLAESQIKDPKTTELECKMISLDIVKEYESIPRTKPNADFTTAARPENIPRNRYKDILPYEENRVKITPSKDNKVGYINASHITASVGDTQRFFICAQGPLASTVGHFWQCVWETDVRLIVMLASVEGDTHTSKSFPYWPQSDNTSVECDQFRIYRKHSTPSGCHVTSRLQLVHMEQRKSRSVWHLQFTDWADHGCPQDTHSFINFLQELSTLRRVTYSEVEGVGSNRNTPVLVHCSAGVGRSGVTILCDLLIEAADHNLPIDPPKVLHHLRLQRMAIVQSFNQYKFVYRVLLTYLQTARLI